MTTPRREEASSDEGRGAAGPSPSRETNEGAPNPEAASSIGNINGVRNGTPGVTNCLEDSARASTPSVADNLSTRQNVNGSRPSSSDSSRQGRCEDWLRNEPEVGTRDDVDPARRHSTVMDDVAGIGGGAFENPGSSSYPQQIEDDTEGLSEPRQDSTQSNKESK